MDKTEPSVGIDVSKRSLDVRPSAQRKAFPSHSAQPQSGAHAA